jgi:hypothetical protein
MAAQTWVIDAANVVGARPDGWWRDRPGAAARLHAGLARLLATAGWPSEPAGQDTPPARIVLVLEGSARAGVEPTGSARFSATRNRPEGTHPPAGGQPAPPAETSAPGDTKASGRDAENAPAARSALTVVHAPAAGDDAIVAAARDAAAPVLVFTSDRGLRARLAEVGAQVRGAGALWDLLDAT